MAKKQNKKRNEIRVYDIPDKLFVKIQKDADTNKRTDGKQVLFFLEKHY